MEYIINPCKYEAIYLATEQNPNKFGEALRNFCFRGNCESTGCYSTFDMMDFLTKVTEGKIFEEAKKYLYDVPPTIYHHKLEEKDCYIEYVEMGSGEITKWKICNPCEIVVGWTWDGDGCLYIRWNDRKVVNTDCKKDYEWEWVK